MKFRILISICLLLLFHLLPAAWSQDSSPDGFYGRVDLGGLWMSSKSWLEAGDDNRRLETLDQKPKSQSEWLPVPSFELGYYFNHDSRVYFGIPFEEEPRPTLGIEFETPAGIELGASLFYGIPDEVWTDPYLTGVNRVETDETRFGGEITCEINGWELGYELEQVDVDKDDIGKRFSELKRDGMIHQFELSWDIELGSGFELIPGAAYTLADIDGKANRYNGYTANLDLEKNWENIELKLSLEAGTHDYDAIHPIFSNTRKDDVYEAMASVSWFNPLGFEGFAVRAGGGYERCNSNINFYDSEGAFAFVTLGYEFGSTRKHRHD